VSSSTMEKITHLIVAAADQLRRVCPAILVLLLCSSLPAETASGCEAHPKPFSFEELVQLANVNPLPTELSSKLDDYLQQPLVCNEASTKQTPNAGSPSRTLRITEWNINRGENFAAIQAGMSGPAEYHARVKSQESAGKRRVLDEQLTELSGSDVIVLNEVDIGVKRTEYRNIVRDLAVGMGMNYVYGIEFIELNPLFLGAHQMDVIDLARQRRAGERFGVNSRLYAGLEGTALLSRYRIAHAAIIRLPQKYDWYESEVNSISALEQARRWSAEKLFDERVHRQVRRGGRMALIVDLEVSQSPTGLITVVCPHLENYTPPAGRRAQMDALLSGMESISNPVVLAGDLNSTGSDGTPTSVKREIIKRVRNPRFWIGQLVSLVIPVPGLHFALFPINYARKYHDPTVVDIPVLLSNREAAMFRDLRKFKFADGLSFDIAGDAGFSFKKKEGTLANSNQRAWKGFAPTYSFRRNWRRLVGSYKLDWILVKKSSQDRLLAPARGRTLNRMNHTRDGRISDHAPVTVELGLSTSEAGKAVAKSNGK